MRDDLHLERTITRQMNSLIGDFSEEFPYGYSKEDVKARIRAYTNAIGKSGQASRRAELKAVFLDQGLKESDFLNAKGEVIHQEKLLSYFPTRTELLLKLVDRLGEMYQTFPSSKNYMQRIVDSLADPNLVSDTLRLTILKHFLSLIPYKSWSVIKSWIEERVGKKEAEDDPSKAMDALTDEVFELLETLKNKKSAVYLFLHSADDLASGRFKSNGATRRTLYLFAFAFGMTFCTEPDEFDPFRDIEKNLFFDYYNNNLLRFIDEEYEKASSNQEAWPTGAGINYKNFMEVIYLYYLRRAEISTKEGTPPWQARADAWARANAMIQECKANEGDSSVLPLGENTQVYKESFKDKVFQMEEEELKEHILRYFDTSQPESASPIINDSEEISAGQVEKDIIRMINDMMKEHHLNDLQEVDLSLLDIISLKQDYPNESKQYSFYENRTFSRLVKKMGDAVKSWIRKRHSGIDSSTRDLSRIDIICAYYVYYNFELSNLNFGMSLADIALDFKTSVDLFLETARYQQFSYKNIFDVFVIASLYGKVNLQN